MQDLVSQKLLTECLRRVRGCPTVVGTRSTVVKEVQIVSQSGSRKTPVFLMEDLPSGPPGSFVAIWLGLHPDPDPLQLLTLDELFNLLCFGYLTCKTT